MSGLRGTSILAQAVRRYCGQPNPTKFNRLKESQKRFQLEDGVPVHLKTGISDRLLYQATVVLTGIGLVMSTQVLYTLSVPKKQE